MRSTLFTCGWSLVILLSLPFVASNKDGSIQIMLIGKTGNGKSGTGNSILMKEEFPVSDGSKSMTKEVKLGRAQYKGMTIHVLDTPGLVDTHDMAEGDANRKVLGHFKDAMALSPHGVSAFVLVLNYAAPRFTKDELDTVRTLQKAFSPVMIKQFGIVLYTNKHNFKQVHRDGSFNDWCKSQDEPNLKELLETVNFRCIAFDNINPTEFQRNELLKMIHNMNPNGDTYTDEHFKKAVGERRRIRAEEHFPRLKIVFDRGMNQFKKRLIDSRILTRSNLREGRIQLTKLSGDVRYFRDDLNRINYPYRMMYDLHRQTDFLMQDIMHTIDSTAQECYSQSPSWAGRVVGAAAGYGIPTLAGLAVPGGVFVAPFVGGLIGYGMDKLFPVISCDNIIKDSRKDSFRWRRESDMFERFSIEED